VIFALVVGWTAVMMLKRNEESDEVEDYSGHLAYRLVKRFYRSGRKSAAMRLF
jgi:tellurite resistance protein TerC